ncbi:hypothetical protein GCM10029964_004470 [Kibdelosporangium lantanae]
MDSLGVHLAGDPGHEFHGVAGDDQQPAAELGVEVPEAAVEEGEPRRAGWAGEALVEHEQAQHLRAGGQQRRVVPGP